MVVFLFFNETATTQIDTYCHTLSLLDALPIFPSARTVVNWLKSFTRRSVAALVRLNRDLVLGQISALGLRRVTIDLDGTVLRTGLQVDGQDRKSTRLNSSH